MRLNSILRPSRLLTLALGLSSFALTWFPHSASAFGKAHSSESAFPAPPAWSQDEFLWGVSNAAFQTEGSPADSDWRLWTHTPGKIHDGSNADHATDFWNRYREDFELAHRIGLNAFRISIAWERIEPSPGVWDEQALAHYREMIEAMRDSGLEPVVTLLHFVLPTWLAEQGGILSQDFPVHFSEFTHKVVGALSAGDRGAKIWITINEPMVMVLGGYVDGGFPPGVTDAGKAPQAAAALAEAHIWAVGAIRALRDPKIRVSIAENWVRFFPKNPANLAERLLVNQTNEFYNHQFIQAAMTGKIDFGFLAWHPVTKTIPLPEGRPTLDFLGINYYFRNFISLKAQPPFVERTFGDGPKSDMGWGIYPAGLSEAMTEAFDRYRLPVMITENGVADAADAMRGKYLTDHLGAIDSVRRAGIPVLGYLQWSLTDNFEWAEGLAKRFGLVEMDYLTGERRPRASYSLYGDLVSARGRGLIFSEPRY